MLFLFILSFLICLNSVLMNALLTFQPYGYSIIFPYYSLFYVCEMTPRQVNGYLKRKPPEVISSINVTDGTGWF